MINVGKTYISHILVRRGQKIQIISRPRKTETRVVQSATPLPVSEAMIPDPGDLTLIFENHLI